MGWTVAMSDPGMGDESTVRGKTLVRFVVIGKLFVFALMFLGSQEDQSLAPSG